MVGDLPVPGSILFLGVSYSGSDDQESGAFGRTDQTFTLSCLVAMIVLSCHDSEQECMVCQSGYQDFEH